MSGAAPHRSRPRPVPQACPGLLVPTAAAAAFGLLVALTTGLWLAGEPAATAVADVGSVLVAAAAGVGCRCAARRATGPAARQGWALLGAGCAVWAVGRLAGALPVPYPAVAAAGQLCFAAATVAAFGRLGPASRPSQVRRRLLDASAVAVAVTLGAWLALVGPALPPTLGLLPPAADLVALALAALAATADRSGRRLWVVFGAAAAAVLVSDLFDAVGAHVPAGWWAAFGLIGAAAVVGSPPDPETGAAAGDPDPDGRVAFAALAGGGIAVGLHYVNGRQLDAVGIGLAALLVGLVLARQYVTARDNRGLARTVQRREAQLQHLAFHDPLTGLANRALFLDRLGHALDLAARERRPVSVVFVDLDGFKAVNDSLGHAMGDALLVAVAQRLRAALRPADTLARLGGDEFAVVVEQGADAATVGRALLAAVRAPVAMSGRTVSVTASIGIATTEPGRVEHAASVLHRADVAMYAVKASGKADVAVHSLDLDDEQSPDGAGRRPRTGRPSLDRALAVALRSGAVHAVFQPAVDPVSGRIRAFEALARWTHEGEPVRPDVFVPICEETGLSEALTAVMLEQSCAQLAEWSRALGHQDLGMAVNLSPTELGDADLPVRIEELLARHGLLPTQLALEITESTLPNRPGVVLDVLHTLRASGVRLALDDFGTGYSTLVRLANTPVDTVKIDRFFLADIDHDFRRLRFLKALVELTRRLGLRTVAEGVERPGQLIELRRLGCGLVQGYLLARPATGPELTPAVLQEQSLLPPGLWTPDAAVSDPTAG